RVRVFLLLLLAIPAAVTADEIELQFLNATYSGLDSGLEPIREGPLTIALSSPEHRLTVYSNRLTLRPSQHRPAGGGRWDAEIEIELDGEGRLVADVEGAGVRKRFVDDVAVRRQTVVASGEVHAELAADGVLFILERPGPAVAVEIRSGLAEQIVGVCRAIALLPLFDLGCDRLQRGLSIARIPMPEAGTRFLLPYSSLTEEERGVLESLIATAGR
ncbi:MAG: hypothetical protein V3T72_18215, partial [Thermoanaerobaculia bacterium]